MDFQKQLNESQENAKLSFYQNPGYQFERREKKNLLIDYKIGQTVTDITLPLFEPLKIDKLSDVYIESFTTFEALANATTDRIAFVVDIKEFNINTSTNLYSTDTTVTNTFNKIIIPNEETGAASNKTKVHKGRKLNYVCTLNPTTIANLTIKITDLATSPPATMFGTNGRILFELIIVARD
tara:strand:- start:1675 stop:2220 length:546 start_codon:yes stop_codon:yes gene_type:complete